MTRRILPEENHTESEIETGTETEEHMVSLGRKSVSVGAIIKLSGILVFFVLVGVIIYLVWPHLKVLFEEGGVQLLIEKIHEAGPSGIFILLGLQLLQIIVAFIPGEFTQIAAGLLYGPWLGTLVILIGCMTASTFVFFLVRKLGMPFVQSMVSPKLLDRIKELEGNGRLKTIVFILFLIPGLPKDIFTYLIPLTGMRLRDFLLFSTVGRIPGVFVSTYVADGLINGKIVTSVIIFAIAAVIAASGMIFRTRLMDLLGKIRSKSSSDEAETLLSGESSTE